MYFITQQYIHFYTWHTILFNCIFYIYKCIRYTIVNDTAVVLICVNMQRKLIHSITKS